MKKILLTAIAFSGTVLLADIDLNVKHFLPPENGSAKIVTRRGWFGKKAIMLNGKGNETAPATAMYKKSFPFRNAVYEVKAYIVAQGTAYIDLVFVNAAGKELLTRRIISVNATDSVAHREYEGKADLRGVIFKESPAAVKLLIGIGKNSSAVFEDIEMEIDDD